MNQTQSLAGPIIQAFCISVFLIYKVPDELHVPSKVKIPRIQQLKTVYQYTNSDDKDKRKESRPPSPLPFPVRRWLGNLSVATVSTLSVAQQTATGEREIKISQDRNEKGCLEGVAGVSGRLLQDWECGVLEEPEGTVCAREGCSNDGNRRDPAIPQGREEGAKVTFLRIISSSLSFPLAFLIISV